MAERRGLTQNSGDDIAGFVHAVGENVRRHPPPPRVFPVPLTLLSTQVTEFHPGDRIAAFHEMRTPGGSYAEYAVSPGATTFHLAAATSFEEAATVPLAAMTAALGLFVRLGLPSPFTPAAHPTPLVVYGGASAVGAFAIKLAVRANIHPIIAVAGRGIPFVEGLLDKGKGDTVVDYRQGDEAVVKGVVEATKGAPLEYAFDAVSEKGSTANIAKVLARGGKVTTVLPVDEGVVPKGSMAMTMVGGVHGESETERDFGYAWFRLFGRGMGEGWFKGHPYEVVPGGLEGGGEGVDGLEGGEGECGEVYLQDC